MLEFLPDFRLIPTLWTALAAAGLVFALIARDNAVDELRALPRRVQNGRRRLGRGHVRDETIISVIDFIWFIIGLIYVASGEKVGNPAVAVPLVMTSALLALSSLMRWRDRVYARRSTPARGGTAHLHRRIDD